MHTMDGNSLKYWTDKDAEHLIVVWEDKLCYWNDSERGRNAYIYYNCFFDEMELKEDIDSKGKEQ